LLSEEEWTVRMKEKRRAGEGSSRGGGDRGGGGKQQGKGSVDKKARRSSPNRTPVASAARSGTGHANARVKSRRRRRI